MEEESVHTHCPSPDVEDDVLVPLECSTLPGLADHLKKKVVLGFSEAWTIQKRVPHLIDVLERVTRSKSAERLQNDTVRKPNAKKKFSFRRALTLVPHVDLTQRAIACIFIFAPLTASALIMMEISSPSRSQLPSLCRVRHHILPFHLATITTRQKSRAS